MEKYERLVGMKSIGLTFVRRWDLMIIMFIPIALVSFAYTQFFMTKTYASNAVVSKVAVFNNSTYGRFTSDAKSDAYINVVVENLKTAEEPVKHADGKEITASEIKSGLSFSAINTTSVSLTLTYTSTDKTVVQPILKEVSTYVVSQLTSTSGDFNGLKVSSEASAASKNSKENRYLLIALAIDVVLSIGVPFIFEIVGDEVYDRKDVENLGSDGFVITASKMKK